MLYVCYALAGLAAGILFPTLFSSITVLTGFFVGHVVFLSGALVHEIVRRHAWQRRTSRQIKALKRAYEDLRGEIFGLRDDTMSILKALNMRAKSRDRLEDQPPANSNSDGRLVRDSALGSAASGTNVPGAGPSVLYEPRATEKPQERSRWWSGKERSNRPRKMKSELDEIHPGSAKISQAERTRTLPRFDPAIVRAQEQSSRLTLSDLGEEKQEQMIQHVRNMLRNKNIVHKIQPIVSLSTGQPVFYECCSHIPSPDGRLLISPQEILPQNNSKIMRGIDSVLLSNAIGIIQRLRDYNARYEKVFINISAGVLESPDMFERFVNLARARGDIQNVLVLDIAHSDILHRRVSWSAINNLSRIGFTLCLQNVETADLDVDTLVLNNIRYIKMKTSLINEITENSGASALLKNFQNLRRQTMQAGIQLIVECVETRETATRAAELGIGYAMGYAIARPERIDLVAGVLPDGDQSDESGRRVVNE